MTFIDFKKAFDMVHRGMMLQFPKAYGVSDKLVNGIAGIYKNTRARVLTPDTSSLLEKKNKFFPIAFWDDNNYKVMEEIAKWHVCAE